MELPCVALRRLQTVATELHCWQQSRNAGTRSSSTYSDDTHLHSLVKFARERFSPVVAAARAADLPEQVLPVRQATLRSKHRADRCAAWTEAIHTASWVFRLPVPNAGRRRGVSSHGKECERPRLSALPVHSPNILSLVLQRVVRRTRAAV
jgi:hypothetical protein